VAKKKSQVEVGQMAESEGSGTGGWRQEVSSALGGDQGALKGAEWVLKRIAKSLDGGLGASEDMEDSTIRE